jgi:hypothetical protein
VEKLDRPDTRTKLEFDPYANDPGKWGASLVNMAEIMIPIMEAAGARSVIEVGAYAGDLTGLLVDWAEQQGDTSVMAIDPSPQPELEDLAKRKPLLQLVRETSHEALKHVPLADVVIIDGDHNYYTVHEELRLVAERASGSDLPLLLFHDVCWPHGRRDDYFDPEQIPEEYRQPTVGNTGVWPGEEGTKFGGLPYKNAAAKEGGPRNGVLTAIEDFVNEREGLKLGVVHVFFGFGIVWHEDAPYAAAVEEILAPWIDNPLLERLEANRVFHLASVHYQMVQTLLAQHRLEKQEAVLRKLLDSGAFTVAEQLSKLRQGGEPAISKAEIRKALAG